VRQDVSLSESLITSGRQEMAIGQALLSIAINSISFSLVIHFFRGRSAA
jgi:hypothetical protein